MTTTDSPGQRLPPPDHSLGSLQALPGQTDADLHWGVRMSDLTRSGEVAIVTARGLPMRAMAACWARPTWPS